MVTVSFPDGSLRSYHVEDGLGGVGFEFAQAGILVLRFQDSDHVLSAFAPTAWTSVSGTTLGDRGRRSSSGAEVHHAKAQGVRDTGRRQVALGLDR
jgi:hypothetical protein